MVILIVGNVCQDLSAGNSVWESEWVRERERERERIQRKMKPFAHSTVLLLLLRYKVTTHSIYYQSYLPTYLPTYLSGEGKGQLSQCSKCLKSLSNGHTTTTYLNVKFFLAILFWQLLNLHMCLCFTDSNGLWVGEGWGGGDALVWVTCESKWVGVHLCESNCSFQFIHEELLKTSKSFIVETKEMA